MNLIHKKSGIRAQTRFIEISEKWESYQTPELILKQIEIPSAL